MCDWLQKQYEARSRAALKAGATIEIHPGLDDISVTLPNGDEYYFSGWEAQELLDAVPDWISREDYILAQAQEW